MATLSGNAIKDSYQGLLKTSDNAAVSSSLKTIQDGLGNDTGMSLSTTTLRAASLEINSPIRSGSANVLVWDSSTKSVGFRNLPTFETVTTTVTGATNPTLTVADAAGNSTAVVFQAGTNVEITQSSNTITFNSNQHEVKTITAATTLSASDSGKTIFLDADNINGDTIGLPPAASGLFFRFYIFDQSNTAFKIAVTDATDFFFGKVEVAGTTDDKRAVQLVGNSTARAAATSHDVITIDANSATGGGSEGDSIEIYATGTNGYLVNANLTTSATPSSIAVIGAS